MMNKNMFILLLFTTARLLAQDSSQTSLIKAAARLKSAYFLNLIPQGKEKDYGIASRNNFSNIKIEEPWQTFYLSCKDQNCSPLSANQWRVPLSIDGNFVALLTVQINQTSHQPEAIDFGANLLAQKIQEFEKLHPSEIGQRMIIRNTILHRDYLTGDPSLLQPVYLINQGPPQKTTMQEIEKESFRMLNTGQMLNTGGDK
jgi:hypothetical protein